MKPLFYLLSLLSLSFTSAKALSCLFTETSSHFLARKNNDYNCLWYTFGVENYGLDILKPLPTATKWILADRVDSFIPGKTYRNNIITALYCFSDIPMDQWSEFSSLCEQLMKVSSLSKWGMMRDAHGIHHSVKLQFALFLKSVPAKQRTEFVEMLCALFPNNTLFSSVELPSIYESIRRAHSIVPVEYFDYFRFHAQLMLPAPRPRFFGNIAVSSDYKNPLPRAHDSEDSKFTPFSDINQYISLHLDLLRPSPEPSDIYVHLVTQLAFLYHNCHSAMRILLGVLSRMDEENVLKVLDILLNQNTDQQLNFVNQALRLIRSGMDQLQILQVFELINTLDASEWEKRVNYALRFTVLPARQKGFIDQLSGYLMMPFEQETSDSAIY